jgi:hypothetical protein
VRDMDASRFHGKPIRSARAGLVPCAGERGGRALQASDDGVISTVRNFPWPDLYLCFYTVVMIEADRGQVNIYRHRR